MSEEMLKTQSGGISVDVEHIFPIIKKWLYSEKEIFVREIVSNACDAVTKLKRLISLGEAGEIEAPEWKIRVILSEAEKTLTVTDNGIGMSEEEVRKYICQIALSGALDFIQKYESADGEKENSGSGIIGHFGLGFYSAFMVSEKVEILSRSYTGANAVRWICSEDGSYTISEADETSLEGLVDSFGTAVVLHLGEEGKEYLSAYRMKDVLEKYCSFLPVPVFFEEAGKQKDKKEDEEEKPINETTPLWQKNPSDCTDDEYKEFYRKVFRDYKEPLFWIHLKADYPLNFRGILYFPKIGNEYESLEGQVKLFYNQVFVADNIKEVVPEYLLMLKGVLDCPELPLNVSRSYLQNNAYVSKISSHIVKKVSDKLSGMFRNDRENYEKIWRDIKTFVEYGAMRDPSFYDKIKDVVLYEKCEGGFATLPEILEASGEKGKDRIYYATDKAMQAKYISMYKAEGIQVILLDRLIDTQFVSSVEAKETDRKVKFLRVDAEVSDALSEGEAEKNEDLEKVFKPLVPEKTEIGFAQFKDSSVPAILTLSEEDRRFEDMMKLYAFSGGEKDNSFAAGQKLVLNTGNPLIGKIAEKAGSEPELATALARQIYLLTVLSQRSLSEEEMTGLLETSYGLLEKLS